MKAFKYATVAIAFVLLTGCMQSASNLQQAQYVSTLRVCPPSSYAESGPFGMAGYRCVPTP